jgi:hypothetical protein
MTSISVTSIKKAIFGFQEYFAQFTTQKKSVPKFSSSRHTDMSRRPLVLEKILESSADTVYEDNMQPSGR